MQSERWRTCTDIFHAALEQTPEERTAFIERACAGDDQLRKQVETLLRYHEEAGDFIASPAVAEAPELLVDDADALIGQQLGNYRIDAVLGVGGMGVVYRAYDEKLGRKVGLKLLPRALVTHEDQLARLKLEARTASALNHPNIVTVHEIGQVESTHYIAIEFIEGETLRERIMRGPTPPAEAIEIVMQVASALCVAHRAGIVHRDIKPENIMVRPDGYVKVLDFGIATSMRGELRTATTAEVWPTHNRTRAGVVLGTMRYMSPEQTRGETVDARSDIWSLGVVLYEMLTTQPPFAGETAAEVRSAVLLQRTPTLDETELPPPVHAIVEQCLHKDPAERFQTSEDLLAALRAASASERDGRGWYWIAGIAAAALIAVSAIFFIQRSTQSPADLPSVAEPPNITLRSSTGVALAPGGTIYVADFSHHTIRRIAPDGSMTDFAGTPARSGAADGIGADARFNNPGDVAADRNGNLFVADTNNHAIRKITPAGAVTTFAGKLGESGTSDGRGEAAQFTYPTGVAVHSSGLVYVADFGNHTVRRIAPDGTVDTLAGLAREAGSIDGTGGVARFNRPHGVAVDESANVYVADFGSHTIRKITAGGEVSTMAGLADNPGSSDGRGSAARFNAPYGVAVDRTGKVYVADSSNHLVRKITLDGEVSTLAGRAGNVGNLDGSGDSARFAVPAALAVNSSGEIYVADFGNHAVRKIGLSGDVSTVSARWAGTPDNESASPQAIPAKSIAVLPFADLSPEKDQQYFSDGMAEEILNALAHVQDLKVAGRSSSFSFRGKDADVRSVGAALGVAHILEGSVRKQGDKVRITAQLVQASDGFHLWSETFDGDLSDVFSLQERIARAITDRLKVVLEGDQSTRLVKIATRSSEAYALYLQASAIFNRRDSARFPDAFKQLEEAIRLDPSFARAHARLASLASISRGYDVQLPVEAGELVVRAARRAIEIDPTLAEPHAALGQTLFTQRRFREAHAAYQQAIAIDPDDTSADLWLASLLSSVGRPSASAAVLDRLLAKDPALPNALLWRGWVHLQLGEIDEAERAFHRAADAGLVAVGLAFAHVAQARGDNAAQVDWLARGLEAFMRDLPPGTATSIAAATTGDPAQRARAIARLEEYVATNPSTPAGAVPHALIWLGEHERALAIAQQRPTRNDTVFLAPLWTDAGRTTRQLPQFSEFARRSGLADFWDSTAAPERCQKNSAGDYICE